MRNRGVYRGAKFGFRKEEDRWEGVAVAALWKAAVAELLPPELRSEPEIASRGGPRRTASSESEQRVSELGLPSQHSRAKLRRLETNWSVGG